MVAVNTVLCTTRAFSTAREGTCAMTNQTKTELSSALNGPGETIFLNTY